MKIYLFNTETGAYLGEDFADRDPFRRGAYVIPDDATTLPPPEVAPGQMPFFNLVERRWEVREVPARRSGRPYDKLGEQPPEEEPE